MTNGNILDPINFADIAPPPDLPSDPIEQRQYFKDLASREDRVQRTATTTDVYSTPDVLSRAEELAQQIDLISFAELLGFIDSETGRMPREDAQRRVEAILLAAGADRVNVSFSPHSSYGVLPERRKSLVSKLGYEPVGSALSAEDPAVATVESKGSRITRALNSVRQKSIGA